MNIEIKKRFMEDWEKYFPNSELPITCFYSNELHNAEFPDAPKPNSKGYTCVFSQLAPVRKGRSRAFNKENLGCFGSFLPFGFDTELTEDVKNYVCNIENIKKSYEHLENTHKNRLHKEAPAKYLVFKRWDTLEEQDNPQVVFFFGNSDVITGLHGLANFDSKTPYSVMAPFGTGCDSIVGYSMNELEVESPKAFLGPLDPSVIPTFKQGIFTFSAPFSKFMKMIENIDNSFLITDNWAKIISRLKNAK